MINKLTQINNNYQPYQKTIKILSINNQHNFPQSNL